MTLDDFAAVNRRATENIATLLRAWFPEGVVEGAEFCIGNLSGAAGKSLRIRLSGSKAGVWGDFSTDDAAGADLISLYAKIHGITQGKACAALAEQCGVQLSESHLHGKAAPPQAGRPPPRPNPAPAQAPRGVESLSQTKTPWKPALPVPLSAGPYPKAHPVRGKPAAFWEYRRYNDDETSDLLGVIYRFTTSDGGKEILPCVWATHPTKGAEWRWMQFSEPRPLYWPTAPRRNLPVLGVEGEKSAYAGGQVLSRFFDIFTWSGGGNAVQKSDYAELVGRHVILWPDCDAKTYKPEHPRAGELLPESDQPGMKAMLKLAAILVELGCTVQIVDIPQPGEKPDGWDIADLIAEGASAEDVFAWTQNLREPIAMPRATVARVEKKWAQQEDQAPEVQTSAPPPKPAAQEPPPDPPPPMPLPLPDDGSTPRPASAKGSKNALRMSLIPTANGGIKSCRENVYLIMGGDARLCGIVGLDQFADKLVKLRNPPWASEPGEWLESDDFELGLYIGTTYGFVLATGDIEKGVAQAARAHAFNPVTDYILACAKKWADEGGDVDRVTGALTRYWGAEDSEYTRLISQMFFTGIVMRAFKPGIKHDHAPVFEGGQGEHKSTSLKVLGGEWFADTPFKMGEKDGYLSIQGVWIYEIAELEQFNRSEVTAIKAFMSSQTDRYREPYGRRMKDKPRKTAFAATTNEAQYFRDTTGNRRFWPVETGKIDIDALALDRDLLFGQAYWMLQGGVKWWPTREQEARLIRPVQESREIEDMWINPIRNYCEGVDIDGKPTAVAARNWVSPTELMVKALGSDLSRLGPAKSEAMRISTIMRKLGWVKDRDTAGMRERGYARPGHEKGGKTKSGQGEDGGEHAEVA